MISISISIIKIPPCNFIIYHYCHYYYYYSLLHTSHSAIQILLLLLSHIMRNAQCAKEKKNFVSMFSFFAFRIGGREMNDTTSCRHFCACARARGDSRTTYYSTPAAWQVIITSEQWGFKKTQTHFTHVPPLVNCGGQNQ